MNFLNLQVTQAELQSGLISVSQTVAQIVLVMTVVNGNLKLTPFTLKQQSKIDPFDDLLRLNLWLNSYSLFIF